MGQSGNFDASIPQLRKAQTPVHPATGQPLGGDRGKIFHNLADPRDGLFRRIDWVPVVHVTNSFRPNLSNARHNVRETRIGTA